MNESERAKLFVDISREIVEVVIEHLREHSGVGDGWDSIEKVLKEQISEECEDLVWDVLDERLPAHVPGSPE